MIKYPKIINLPITEICDSHCIMCNVWNAGNTDQFTNEDIKQIFSQKLFKKVKHIGISGGEPTLNNELVEICQTLISIIPNLKTLSITSNGYNTEKHQEILPLIKTACLQKKVSFSLNLSLDGYGEIHQKVRRVDNAFDKVTATANLAKNLGIPVQLQCTVMPINVYNIVRVREYALSNNYEVIFRLATFITRLSNGNLLDKITLNDKQKSFFADFLESKRTIFATNSLGRRLFYTDLAARLKKDAPRKAPCWFQSKALYISPNQTIYHCSRSEKKLKIDDIKNIKNSINNSTNKSILNELIQKTCPNCYHDQSGRWPLWKYFTVLKILYNKIETLKKIKKIPSIILNSLIPIRTINIPNKTIKTALIIGCYGGEHVGDAAILGGVILRIIKKFEIKKFYVLSFRPDRTECWVKNLIINDVSIKVVGINQKITSTKYDALFLAGGPLMSIPTLLSRHLKIIRTFNKNHKPFYIEGIGIGPLNDVITKKMVKKIIKSAIDVTVRTNTDVKYAKTFGVNPKKTFDPAFDYLEHLKTNEIKVHSSLKNIIDTEKDIWVINLRPLWKKYSRKKCNLQNIEEEIIDSITKTLFHFRKNKRFVFMPMNADQFGFSDFEIAYKLDTHLKSITNEIDFRIWEYEPDINNCVYLLKKSKLCISMRFHGCIFSLANNIPTIGLDYSTSGKGKVYSLFEDFKLQNQVLNIKNINSNSLINIANKLCK